jgi:uncharacterized membrane protein
MDESTLAPATNEPRLTERWHAVVDFLYLSQVTYFYIFSALYPGVGLFYGILLLAGGVTPKTKRIGRICLILGIVNTVVVILALGVVLALGLAGALAGLGND